MLSEESNERFSCMWKYFLSYQLGGNWIVKDVRRSRWIISFVGHRKLFEQGGRLWYGSCDLLDCRPKWMQRFGSRNWMLLWMCWFCTVQGLLINGLVPSAITSIERRFQFSSSTIGRIMQARFIISLNCLFLR